MGLLGTTELTNVLLLALVLITYHLVMRAIHKFETFCSEFQAWKEDLLHDEARRTLAYIVEEGVTNTMKMASMREPTETDMAVLDLDHFDKLAEKRGVLSQIVLAVRRCR